MYALKTLFLAAGLATALPQPGGEPPSTGAGAFEILALRSASPIHFTQASAAESSIFLALPHQKASCARKSDGTATFYIKDGGLYLYSTENPPQRLFVDRSGMGQGKLGYVTGAEPAPKNAELTGFKVNKAGDLVFKGSSFLACPHSIEKSWSVWVEDGVANPGGNKGCLGFSARVVDIAKPNSCLYTEA